MSGPNQSPTSTEAVQYIKMIRLGSHDWRAELWLEGHEPLGPMVQWVGHGTTGLAAVEDFIAKYRDRSEHDRAFAARDAGPEAWDTYRKEAWA